MRGLGLGVAMLYACEWAIVGGASDDEPSSNGLMFPDEPPSYCTPIFAYGKQFQVPGLLQVWCTCLCAVVCETSRSREMCPRGVSARSIPQRLTWILKLLENGDPTPGTHKTPRSSFVIPVAANPRKWVKMVIPRGF